MEIKTSKQSVKLEDGICPDCGADLIKVEYGAVATTKLTYDKQSKEWVVDTEEFTPPTNIRFECSLNVHLPLVENEEDNPEVNG